MQRVIPSEPFNPEPTAKYFRTLADAFPCNSREAVAIEYCPVPRRTGRLLPLALVLLIVMASLGCSAEAGTPPVPASKRDVAAAHACHGITAVWMDETTLECFKERP